jgi:hypothetical protein
LTQLFLGRIDFVLLGPTAADLQTLMGARLNPEGKEFQRINIAFDTGAVTCGADLIRFKHEPRSGTLSPAQYLQ